MKYFLRKTKIKKKVSDSDDSCDISEIEIEKKDIDKQVFDNNFNETQIHVCRHDEGLPCQLINIKSKKNVTTKKFSRN